MPITVAPLRRRMFSQTVVPDGLATRPESLILDPETTSGWTVVNGASVTLESTDFTLGTKAVSVNQMGAFWDNNPNLTSKGYVNLTSATERGDYSHIALDLRWKHGTGSSPHIASDAFELFASTADDMGGTVVASPIPYYPGGGAFYQTVYIPVQTLSSVKCIGVRSKRILPNVPGRNFVFSFAFDNIRWAARTQLEVALAGADAVILPPDYTPGVTQRVLDLASDQSVLDLRPKAVLANANGVKSIRQFQVLDESGETDLTQTLTNAFAYLQPGDTLQFAANAEYRIDNTTDPVWLRYLNDVTIDANGARFYSTIDRVFPFFAVMGCRQVTLKNFRIFGARPLVRNGSQAVTISGSPTVSGNTVLLDAQNEEVRSAEGFWARDKDYQRQFDFSLSDSNQVANDCYIELRDAEAPTTAPTAAAVGTDGPVATGTRYYRVTFYDAMNEETCTSPSVAITLSSPGKVDLSNIPVAPARNPEVVMRHIYRTQAGAADEPQNYWYVGAIHDNTTTTWRDTFGDSDNPPNAAGMAAADGGAGNVEAGTHYWRVSFVDNAGLETIVSQGQSQTATLIRNASVSLTGIPVGGGTITKRRIYRTEANHEPMPGNFLFVGEIADNVTTTFNDNVADASLGDRAPELIVAQDVPWLPYKTLTLTSSPTTYSLVWDGRVRPNAKMSPRVKKLTATANTITVHSFTHGGLGDYSGGNETCHGIRLDNYNQDIRIENLEVEGISGDGVISAGRQSVRTVVSGFRSRCTRRQGIAFTNGGPHLLENAHIFEPARSGIDIEPPSNAEQVHGVTVRNVHIRSPGNNGLSMGPSANSLDVLLENVRLTSTHSAGTLGFLSGGAEILTMRNCHAPYWLTQVVSERPVIDGLDTSQLYVTAVIKGDMGGWASGGGSVMNVRLSDKTMTEPLKIRGADVYVANVSQISRKTTPVAASAGGTGPFEVAADTGYAILDPGAWRKQFPSTYKGVVAGNLWFPRGLDLRSEPVVRAKSLSSGSTRGTNLAGRGVTLGNGVTSKAITFPTQTNPTFTSYTVSQATHVNGTLSAGTTYFYKAAARLLLGGPSAAHVQRSLTPSGLNNTVQVIFTGLRVAPSIVEALTIYRGTTTNVYTTRYDIVPNHDLHAFGADGVDQWAGYDFGAVFQINSVPSQRAYGYPTTFSPTDTSGHPSWTGTEWTVQDETGYEPDTDYDVWVTTSFNNGGYWITNKTRTGFTVNWATATADANQTLSWLVVR